MMELTKVYHVSEDEERELYHALARNFFHDDLYQTIFVSDASRRWALPYLFQHYMKAMRPYCHVLADSKELHCVMVLFDSTLEQPLSYRLRMLTLIIKMIPIAIGVHSLRGLRRSLDCMDMFTSKWTKEFVHGDYYHVDLMYTEADTRHQGLARRLLQEVVDLADQEGKDVTLETHHQENVAFYEKAGFTLMSTITHEAYDLRQYCMLHKGK